MIHDRKFPTLNAARGVGAVMVVGTHAAYNTGQILRGWTGGPLARLDFGVAIFFVLSGFLLSRPTFLALAAGTPRPGVLHYFWKRALRVLPLYWLVVAVALLFDPANKGLGLEVWVRQLTLTQLYFPTLLPQSLTQMWSLCTEVAFYVCLPLICWLLTRRPGRAGLHVPTVAVRAGILFVAGVAWQSWFAHVPGSEGHFLQWLPGYLPWFLVGMVFAAVSADLTVFPRPHVLDRLGADLAGCWILAAGLFAVACTPVAGPRIIAMPLGWEAGTKDVLYAATAGLLLLPLVFGPEREGAVRERLSGRAAVWLGDISYGVFAIHLFVMGWLFRALDIVPFTGHFVTILVLDLAITFVLATLSYRFFERPILRLKNHRWIVRPAPLSNDLEPLTIGDQAR
jgi:peptidoglycan/LPS O-acetylase OafA/YrhL